MPLFAGGTTVQNAPENVPKFIERFPEYKESASVLKNKSCKSVPADSLVYVCQREFAVVCPDDQKIDIIGTEDATTCHMLAIRHSGSGVTALAHCDGAKTEHVVNNMVKEVNTLSVGGPEGRLEAHVVGGFIDPRKESIGLTKELFNAFINCDKDIHLVTACFTDLNDVIKEGIHFPAIYGIGVEVKTGTLYPATFPKKGPDMHIRGALAFAGYEQIHNVYDCKRKELVIGPYTWKGNPYVAQYLSLPDEMIRKYLSTSPEQEPPGFEDHVRSSLKTLQEHPKPMKTLFQDGLPRRYNMTKPGIWERVVPDGGKGDSCDSKSSQPVKSTS